MRPVVLVALLLCLGGCASNPKSQHVANNDWFPKCERVNCTEPVAELHAPENATLSFETCLDGANRKYSYRRSGAVWILTSYTMTEASCPSTQP